MCAFHPSTVVTGSTRISVRMGPGIAVFACGAHLTGEMAET
jgi:hypothetical protein